MKHKRLSAILIKKYPNRRLYNTQISSYVTLTDLFKMVKSNANFKVIDTKTKEDITRSILTQIIFEQEAKGYHLLPISFLRQIINCYNDQPYNLLPHYLESMMVNFSETQEKLNKLTPDNPIKIFEELRLNNIEILENSFNIFCKTFNLEKKNHE
jgi:polyhydroxyalkanoate synthesis repressor PhaR